MQRFRCWEYSHWIKISNISHRHKNRFTIESHPKVTVLTIFFFPKRRKRGLWRVTNKFRGDWNLSWLDNHLNHQAVLSAGCSQIKSCGSGRSFHQTTSTTNAEWWDFAVEGGEWGSGKPQDLRIRFRRNGNGTLSNQEVTTQKYFWEFYDFPLSLRWEWNFLVEMLADELRKSIWGYRFIDFLLW